MGTWGSKPFSNDDALDWLDKLATSATAHDLIRNTIERINETWDGDAAEAERAIAACALVSAASTEPIGPIARDAKRWIAEYAFVPDKKLIELAIRALLRIGQESEIRELYDESENLPSWIKENQRLRDNLNRALVNDQPIRTSKKRAAPRLLYKLIELYLESPTEELRGRITEKVASILEVDTPSSETNYCVPLYLLAAHGLVLEAETLLHRGANPNGLAGRGNPFCTACANGHLAMARLLQGFGAGIYQTDLNGDSLLHKAAESGNLIMARYLVKLGVPVNCRTGANAESALHYAVKEGHLSIVKYLLEVGADPNLIDKFEGEMRWYETPLDKVDQTKHPDVYSHLRERGGLTATEVMGKQH